MTEEQTLLKSLRKLLLWHITNALSTFSEDEKKKLKEYLEINFDIKKNKINISIPLSFAKYLER